MGTIRVRFIMVALVVSFFAVGMSAFLNYFKYKSTIGGIVKSRVLVIGRGIENSVQASLQLGMQFTDLGTLTQQLQRERSSDRVIRGIDVFDSSGQVIYSSDRNRVGQKVPESWLTASERSKTTEWAAEAADDYVAGISVKNSFDLTVGFLALRYSREEVERAAALAGREILTSAIAAFLGIALIAPLALIIVIRRFERDLDSLEAAAGHIEDKEPTASSGNSAFDAAIDTLRTSLRDANKSLDEVRESSMPPAESAMLEKNYLWRVYWRLAGVIMLCVVAALAVVSFYSHQVFERELIPETEQKAATVAASVRLLVLKATASGVQYDQLYGVEQTFAEMFEENTEFKYAALTDTEGKRLHARGKEPAHVRDYFRDPATLAAGRDPATTWKAKRVDTQYIVSVPIIADKPLGMLHIGIDDEFVANVLLEVMLDVVVVLVVSLFFTLELLNFMAGARLASGLGEFQQQVDRMRAGDFTATARIRANDEIGRMLRRIDAAIDHLNVRYEFLVGEYEDKLRTTTGARREALRPVANSLDTLRGRLRFGSAAKAAESDEMNLNRIRAPLFAFILAEELTRSYLPNYVNQLLVVIPGLSPQVVIGLPIMLFMLIVALGQPYLGSWSERIGRRRAMLIGAAVATVGFAATAFSINLYDLLLWRSLCAIGYAMVFVAAQGYVLDRTGQHNRAQGFALFIGAIMVATVCGPSIGGILADNIGYRLAFLVSAVISVISLVAIARLPAQEVRSGDSRRPSRGPRMREVLALIVNRRFMTLTGLAAMPAKIILTGVCFYLVPLYIVSIGNTSSMAGRMLMVYAVMMVLIVPLSATLSDASTSREKYVSAGLIISGLSGMLLLANDSFLVLFGVVFLLGLGQALSIAAQSALVSEHCQEEIRIYGHDAVYGVYRLLERLGNALGPLLASLLVVFWGYKGAFIGISGLVLVCGLLFTLLAPRLEPHAEPART